jgi:hypothetical protein
MLPETVLDRLEATRSAQLAKKWPANLARLP